MVRLYRTFSIYIVAGETRYAGCCALVRGGSSTSNLLEPHHYRDSKVCRVLSHEFGVIRPYRTFSIYIVAGETRCAGCLFTCSGLFKHIEPRRTFPNHIITEIAKCVNFCHMSSGWFDHTEPPLSTSLQGKQSKVWKLLSHEFGVIRLY